MASEDSQSLSTARNYSSSYLCVPSSKLHMPLGMRATCGSTWIDTRQTCVDEPKPTLKRERRLLLTDPDFEASFTINTLTTRVKKGRAR
jgi:hypothetical protein